MKNRTLMLVTLGVVLIGAACAPPTDEEPASGAAMSAEDAMNDLVQRWDATLAAGEVEGAVALYDSESPVVMPPDQPAQSGQEGLRVFFGGMFADGGLDVSNREGRVLSSGDLVIARGTYTLAVSDESGAQRDEAGKWTAVAKRKDDGSLVVLRNIWNRDAPPPGTAAPPPIGAAGPAAAEDAPCFQSPKAVDEAFPQDFMAGNVAVLVASHAEQGARMPPGRPPVEGRIAIGAYLQTFVDGFPERDLELTDVEEQVDGDLGYAWGRYRFSYAPAAGGDPLEGRGKYVAVSRKGADGCWRHEWVIWNSDDPWPLDS